MLVNISYLAMVDRLKETAENYKTSSHYPAFLEVIEALETAHDLCDEDKRWKL